VRTAHGAGEALGWAIITHPFHPRCGQRFRVLKARRYRGEATLILEGGECGTFSILEDWTDKGVPAGEAAHLFSAPTLLELVKLAQRLKEPGVPASTNQKGIDRCA
jgi:hypothetical protein